MRQKGGIGETRARVAELLASGFSQAAIASELGISASTVCYHARRLGLPAQNKFTLRYDWDEVQRFYDEGNSITACQLRFGFARKTFMDAVQRGVLVSRPHAAPLETYLVAGRRVNRHHLKGLALHHVNGDGLDNLMLLCPNCHSQTENFSGRNRGRLAALHAHP
jgi:hypothetical protein